MDAYGGMDQPTLDAAYNNSRAVTDSARILDEWQRRSKQLRARRSQHLDMPYGGGQRQKVDYFSAGASGPVLLFIHGGYWQMRAREDFSFLVEGPLSHGIDVAMVGYTLAPEATIDEIVEQMRLAVRWVASKAGSLGGDADHLMVSGWSAGGHLTAMAMQEPAVRAGLAISGIFDLEPIRHSYLNEKLQLTYAAVQANSPIHFPAAHTQPMIVAYGGDELPELQRQSVDYAAARAKAAAPVELMTVPGCHHFSVLEQLSTSKGALTQAVVRLAGAMGRG